MLHKIKWFIERNILIWRLRRAMKADAKARRGLD